jgi:hypothetical protein
VLRKKCFLICATVRRRESKLLCFRGESKGGAMLSEARRASPGRKFLMSEANLET